MKIHKKYLLARIGWRLRKVYRALFSAQLDPETLAEVRTAINGELVTGTGRFKAEIETMLGRRVYPGRRGRPRKQIETNLSQGENNEQRSFAERL